MKICIYILKISNGGAERAAISFANFAAKQGYEVDLLCSIKDDSIIDIDKNVNFIKLKDVNRKNIFTRILSNYQRKRELDKYFNQAKPDVLFYMVYPFILNTVKFPKNMTVVGSDRGNPAEYTDEKYVRRRKKLLSKTDGLICQTKRACDFFNDLNMPKFIIPNGIYNDNVYKVERIKEKENSICAVGRFVYEKDYPTLLNAFKLVNVKHPNIDLKIYGTGELKEQILDQISNLGLSNNVKLMGVVKNIPQEIAKSKCFVMSSISEGMPNALIEAMAVGLPCVSTDCPNGPAELIQNDVSGLLVPIKDPNLLSEAICKMLEDQKFADMCGENALKIRETNDAEKINKLYLSSLLSVVKNKK